MEAFERPGYNERPLNASVFFVLHICLQQDLLSCV